MSVTKAKIYNLALGALLLQRQVVNPETETSNEAKVLNQVWDTAFESALADMDLNGTASHATLELLVDFRNIPHDQRPVSHWHFAYKYPPTCAFFRRIKSHQVIDDKSSHIPKVIGIYEQQKVIFCNKPKAIAEFVPKDFPITALSASASYAAALRLAIMASALVTGKGSKPLIESLEKRYMQAKGEAQAQDSRESFFFQTEATMSEFVEERVSGYGDAGDGDHGSGRW